MIRSSLFIASFHALPSSRLRLRLRVSPSRVRSDISNRRIDVDPSEISETPRDGDRGFIVIVISRRRAIAIATRAAPGRRR